MKLCGKFVISICSAFLFVAMINRYAFLEKQKALNPRRKQAITIGSPRTHFVQTTSKAPAVPSYSPSLNRKQPPCQTTHEKVVYLKIPRKYYNKTYFDESSCAHSKDANWTMFTFVKSAVTNFRHREIIRRTWASLSYIEGGRFAIVFVIGRTTQRNQSLLDEEIEKYEDILQINVTDEYRYVGQKSLAGMQWASENLPQNYYYSSCDDDFLINMGGVQEKIEEHRLLMLREKWPEFPILCFHGRRVNDVPGRDGKYYVPYEEYKWPDWPDYCLGGMYTTTVSIAKKLWEASRTENPIRMDDVWITGILREKIGMPRQFIKEIIPSLATHYFGFSNRKSLTAKEYVKTKWRNIYNKLKDKLLCFYDS